MGAGRSHPDERGAVAIIVALSLTLLAVVGAMVLDLGLVRVDRQVTKSAADSAALAGAGGLTLSGSTSSHPYTGICTALQYLRVNGQRFGGLDPATPGAWRDGNGNMLSPAGGNACTDPTFRQKTCIPGQPGTWGRYVWNGAWQNTGLLVIIQSGYEMPAAGWPEDNLPAAQAYSDDKAQGCDQLAVIIQENRKPGLGSVATGAQLTSAVRTVARVQPGPGKDAPAMLLLKRSGCPVLSAGTSAGGSHIYVYGSVTSDGHSQPGTIHADSNGVGCTGGSGKNIFLGNASNGIVAFAAPQPSGYPACVSTDTCVPDTSKPGMITSVAAANGQPANVVSDGVNNVFGSASAGPSAIGSYAKSTPTGRDLVTRTLIDQRYLTAVQGMATSASSIWGLTAANAAAAGYAVVNSCSPSATQIPNATMVFVNCTANNGFTGPATFSNSTDTIVFNGSVKPTGLVKIPNATHVYIFGDPTKDALSLTGGNTFSMHTGNSGQNAVSGSCNNGISPNKAIMVIKSGDLKETGGLLQMCYTTVLMEGNSTNACLSSVPSQEANGPTSTPCSNGTAAGDGQLSQQGGDVDWTAPNTIDVIQKDAQGNPDATAQTAWSSPDGPEDLAFWSESYGSNNNPTYNMAGSGTLHIVGVYMLPNADPFIITGGASQALVNAQYIASSISLSSNNTQISMRVDPNSAVTTPQLNLVGLVR